MDIDAANMEIEHGQTRKGGLSQEEMKKRRSKGRCFRCGRQGHMKKDCPAKKQSSKGDKQVCQTTIQSDQKESQKAEAEDTSGAPPNYENQSNLTTEDRERIVDEMMGLSEDF